MRNFFIFGVGLIVGAALVVASGTLRPAPELHSKATIAVELDDPGILVRFNKLWRKREMIDGVFANRWLGIPTIQNPLDVWITQEILFEVKPDFVVEAGTFMGGSAALWATILEQINPDGRVITIDIEDRSQQARKLPIVQRMVDFLVGSSTDPAIVADVTRRTADRKVVVILDSLHTRDHVRAELEAYADLIPVGSYIIVQDTGIGFPSYGWEGAADGVHDFLASRDDFEVDLSRERFLITNNPHGFLKRVR